MQSSTIPPETLHCINFIPPIQSLWSPYRHPIRENKTKGGDIYVPPCRHTHMRAREAVYICLDISIMLCVPVHGRRLRSGRGDASLGQPLRPWHDSSDLSPLLLAQLAQVRLHAGWDPGVQGAPRAASPACGRRQPFGEPFPFQARLVAHGSAGHVPVQKPAAAGALPAGVRPEACRLPGPGGSAPSRPPAESAPAQSGPQATPAAGRSSMLRAPGEPLARSLPPGCRLSAGAAQKQPSSASPAPSAPPRAPPPRRARTARAPPRTGDVRHAHPPCVASRVGARAAT